MALFQKSVLRKYLHLVDYQKVNLAWTQFQAHFLNPQIQENIRNSKEEQYQGEFLIDLFVNVLGYTKNPQPNFNLTTEYKNEKDSKKADGAIIINDKVLAVIELKGTNTTDLNKIETQAFGYKNNQKECIYVITSNFEKLRFYIDNAIEHIEFNLFQLTREEFDLLYVCLHQTQIEKGIPKKIKDESLVQEEDITKKLYKDYSLFKRELFTNLCERNPDYNQLEVFKKTQKLLDRFLFVFFAEDRGLIPPNSVRTIIQQWNTLKELDAYIPLMERFKQFFGYFNSGYQSKDLHIFAYNGGLFAPDEFLDTVKIDDQLLYKHTVKLADYNFASEVDVNILGHIFENSLNEIDEIKAQIAGETIDKTKTKRKKDGVFYTPKYITKYIVENTVGKLCTEQKEALGIQEEEYLSDAKRNKNTIKKLADKLTDYRNWLLQLTICDPACGSGAFLNQALEFLIAEHRYIDELQAKLFGDSFVLTDIENSILENNLFGVDLNEESVEIAKLSLWLRTAQPNRKLNNLNNNIKCGNSLIDDPAVAGDKAFNWQQEFPTVFAKGGFDVIIGNPPYVKLETIKKTSEALAKLSYKTFDKRGDLYVLFVEKGFDILKDDGTISYIMPNKWLQAGYGAKLRSYLLETDLELLIDFGDIQIFEGATTYPVIFISNKKKTSETFKAALLKKELMHDFLYNIEFNTNEFKTADFSGETWVISSGNNNILLNKLDQKFKTLKQKIYGEASRGIIPGLTEAFVIDEATKLKLVSEDISSSEIIAPLVRGRDITRYGSPKSNNLDYIILAKFESYKYLESDYPAIFHRLVSFEDKLKKRGQCNGSKITDEKPYPGAHHWLELDNCPTDAYLDLFKKPKIMYQVFQVSPCFIFDTEGYYCNNSMWILPTDDKGLLAILNSKMGWWLITKYCTQIQNGVQLIWKYFGQIPVPNTTDELKNIADQMLQLNKDLQEINKKFINLLKAELGLTETSKAIEKWYELSFADFCKELKKKKIELSLAQKSEWMDFFEIEKKKAQELQQRINQTDKEIDRMVYKLYELTEEEIKIVEAG